MDTSSTQKEKLASDHRDPDPFQGISTSRSEDDSDDISDDSDDTSDDSDDTSDDNEFGAAFTTPSGVLHSGFLYKEGSNYKTWKRRFFVLEHNGHLSYYSREIAGLHHHHHRHHHHHQQQQQQHEFDDVPLQDNSKSRMSRSRNTGDSNRPLGSFDVRGLVFQQTECKGKPHCLQMIRYVSKDRASTRLTLRVKSYRLSVGSMGSFGNIGGANNDASGHKERDWSISHLSDMLDKQEKTSSGLVKQEFFFHAFSRWEMHTWKRKLLEVGAVFNMEIDRPVVDETKLPPMERLRVIDVRQWNNKDVLQWLSLIRVDLQHRSASFSEKNDRQDSMKVFKRILDLYRNSFTDESITGERLLSLTLEDLAELGVSSFGIRHKLLQCIENLRNDGFNPDYYVVLDKVEKVRFFRRELDLVEMEASAKCLTYKEHMRDTYLNSSKIGQRDLFKWKQRFEREQRQKQQQQQQRQQHGGQEQDCKNIGLDSTLAESKFDLSDDTPISVPIKLVITEITKKRTAQSLRKIIAPLSAVFAKNDSLEYGIFHAALIVGTWYLEFNDSSLCIPRKMTSSMAIVNADIGSIYTTVGGLAEIADMLSEIAVEWNSTKTYKSFKVVAGKVPETDDDVNCQEFVETVLRALRVKPVYGEAMESFLKQMRTRGKSNAVFRPSKAFRSEFNIKSKSVEFRSHPELDNFVNELLSLGPDISVRWPSEWSLLKSFDRAFWLKHLQNRADPTFLPSTTPPLCSEQPSKPKQRNPLVDASYCPFGRPDTSGSMMHT